VVRDPDHGPIDTNHTVQMHEWSTVRRNRSRAAPEPLRTI
jgi:hypothetical protein